MSSILLASTPNALIGLTGSAAFVVVAHWSATLAAITGMIAVIVAQYTPTSQASAPGPPSSDRQTGWSPGMSRGSAATALATRPSSQGSADR